MSGSIPARPAIGRVAMVTLGCARNEVDSEELAGRLSAEGWRFTDPDDADVVVVNTCGFVEAAKKDSVDTLLRAKDIGAKVVAVGCLAERYGAELAGALPESDAVLSFDDYPDISSRLTDVLAGRPHTAHQPRDRRALLPITPVDRHDAATPVPGHGAPAPDLPYRPGVLRHRLDASPVAPLKIASGCDRRCAFCAIPSFRGAFLSRPVDELVTEASWLAGSGVRELVLVSENSTSYGKDLGDPRLLEALLPRLAAVDGIDRVRVSYLQPAELRPTLVEVIAATPGVAPYFDLSFQHASEPLLRRMRRFGSATRFLALLERIRAIAPEAGARSNVIVGFPGETDDDVDILTGFLTDARLDAVGVFGYSDEDGTEAAGYADKVPDDVIAARVEQIGDLVDELSAQRAEDRAGTNLDVLVEEIPGDGTVVGRAAHQAPEVDGSTTVTGVPVPRVGDLVRASVTGSEGVDLIARYVA